MNTRNLSTVAFVAVCLLLSGLVLRRQMVAHPVARELPQNPGNAVGPAFPMILGQPVDKRTWHIAQGQDRAAVVSSIQAELAAFRNGDGALALSYQTRHRRGGFISPEAFLSLSRRQSPELSDSRAAQFGPVWRDVTGQHADVTVTVRGANGRLAKGAYEMVRTRDMYRIAAVSMERK